VAVVDILQVGTLVEVVTPPEDVDIKLQCPATLRRFSSLSWEAFFRASQLFLPAKIRVV